VTSICVFTDVHAHEAALVSILDDAQTRGIARLWCLGDYASGGPQPAACFDLVHDRCELILAGNHEVFVFSKTWREYPTKWALAAREAVASLGMDRVERLAQLPHGLKQGAVWTVHGSLSDPAHDFIAGAPDAAINFISLRAHALVFGHTHQPAYWTRSAPNTTPVMAEPAVDERVALDERALINPGAGADSGGARWLELEVDADGAPVAAIWRQTAVGGHLALGSLG